MAKMLFELQVEMDDGATYRVVADQRDVARWEVQPYGWPVAKIEDRMSMLFCRFLGWSAASRQQLTVLSWEDFDGQCVEALPVEEDGLADDAADPGRTAR
jgi:hypothetical protein